MKNHRIRPLTVGARAAIAAAVLALAACASTPPPTDQLARAEAAIKRAEDARVADYSSPELKSAREKLTAARDAVTREDMTLAARLADQAAADAELAAAKGEAMRAQDTSQDLKKGNEALRQESLRNSTNVPPVVIPPPPPPPAPQYQ